MKTQNILINDKNIRLVLGENAKENHLLIDNADPNDWWFHLDNYPSGHCIVENDKLTDDIIMKASKFVKENSKFKNIKIKLIYLQIKHLKKTKNLGEVKLLIEPNYFLI